MKKEGAEDLEQRAQSGIRSIAEGSGRNKEVGRVRQRNPKESRQWWIFEQLSATRLDQAYRTERISCR